MRILVANGPNLDLLGQRESEHYTQITLSDLEKNLVAFAKQLEIWLKISIELECYQFNYEGDFCAKLSEKPWSGIILNPAAWTHTSLVIADRMAALKIPFVEVHLSNLSKRESFRRKSYTAPLANGVIYGLGELSYQAGLLALVKSI